MGNVHLIQTRKKIFLHFYGHIVHTSSGTFLAFTHRGEYGGVEGKHRLVRDADRLEREVSRREYLQTNC